MSLKVSVIANFLGTAWTAVIGFVMVPIYIRLLGVEAYGLIGFFSTLRAMFAILSLGLSPATNREIAKRSRFPEKAWESLNLVRTLEIIFYSTGVLVACALGSASGWIAHKWIAPQTLSPETAHLAIAIFGIFLMIRWPIELYNGVFRGLERQAYLNTVSSIASLVNALGAVIILAFISRTLTAFLLWQVVGSLLELLVMALLSWRLLRGSSTHRAVFDSAILRSIWRFSATMTGVSFLAIILKQLDRLLISKFLPLTQLGYYTTGSTASQGLNNLINPIAKAAFPRFTSLLASGNTEALARTYHGASKTMAFLVTPAAMSLIFFGHEILLVWTHSPDVAEHARVSLSLLSIASLFNCFMGPPQALNLASGHATIPLWTNLVGVIVLAPMGTYLVWHYGLFGAGFSWVLFNLGYFLIVPHFIHRRALQGHVTQWYVKDIAPFVILGTAIFPATAWISRNLPSPWGPLGALLLGGLVYTAIGLPLCPPARDLLGTVRAKFLGKRMPKPKR